MTCMTLRKMVVTYWDLCVRATYCKVCESNLWSVPRSWPAWSLWRQGGIKLFLEPNILTHVNRHSSINHTQTFLEPDFDSNLNSRTVCQCWTWQRSQTETWTQSLARLMCPIPNILESSSSSSLEVSDSLVSCPTRLIISLSLLSTERRGTAMY